MQSIDNPFSVNEILEICKEEEEKKLTFNISADCAKHRKPLLSELNFRNMQKKKTNLENFSGLRRAWTFPSQWTRSSRHPWRSSMICWAGACIIISSNNNNNNDNNNDNSSMICSLGVCIFISSNISPSRQFDTNNDNENYHQ